MMIDRPDVIGRRLAGLLLAGLLLAGLLAGCSVGGPASPPTFGEGLAAAKLDPVIDAWIVGDATALSTAIQTVKADGLAARSVPDWETACTEAALAARTANLTAILAESLNEPTVLAMPDLARMDFLDVLGQGQLGQLRGHAGAHVFEVQHLLQVATRGNPAGPQAGRQGFGKRAAEQHATVLVE